MWKVTLQLHTSYNMFRVNETYILQLAKKIPPAEFLSTGTGTWIIFLKTTFKERYNNH